MVEAVDFMTALFGRHYSLLFLIPVLFVLVTAQ